MSTIKNIKVFSTAAHSCSYLSDREATTLFVDPELEVNQDIYSQLNELGFRRSGKHFYSPHCQDCNACIPTRVPVDRFSPSRRQERIIRRNQDLSCTSTTNISLEEHYPLYKRYIEARHSEGDMYPPDSEQFKQFIGESSAFGRYLEFRHNDALVAVSVLDKLNDGYSAIYTYFDPEFHRRSLGAFAVLQIIALAQSEQLGFVYLGYWIRECQKMSYKVEYRPIELLLNGRWQRLA